MRLRANNQGPTLVGASLNATVTTLNFGATAPGFQTLTSPDYYAITLEPGTALEEIVDLTAYTAGATTGTILRAQEGTGVTAGVTGYAHGSGALWVHAPTALDFTSAQRCFDVKEYGGYGDGLMMKSDIVDVQGFSTTVTDGAITSGTKNFNSGSSAFTGLGHLGMVIQVNGAGTAGANLHSCFVQVNSATQMQLQNNAATTVSGATATWGSGASMASGSTTLQDNNNAVFTGRHIGYVIRVKGAGVSGADLVTTIASTNVPAYGLNASGANAILATAAGTEVIGASWTMGPGYLSGLAAASSTTFKDNTNGTFASTDVGKRILLIGAGSGGADVLTSIASVTSATTVVLASGTGIVAPTARTATVNYTANSYVITYVSGTALPATGDVGQLVTCSGFAVGTVVTAVAAGSSWTVSAPQTGASASGVTLTLTANTPYMYSFGGSMTAASNVLTDAHHTFTAADSGKMITVRNALKTQGWGQASGTYGSNGSINNPVNCNANTLVGYAKYLSATTVGVYSDAGLTTALNATSTTFCATYALAHDDLAALTSAVTAAQAAGDGVVSLEAGAMYGLSAPMAVSGGGGFALAGGSRRASTLLCMQPMDGGGNPMLFSSYNRIQVEDLNFEGNLLCPQLLGVNTNEVIIHGVYVRNCRFTETSQNNAGQWTVHFNANHSYNLVDVQMTDCIISNVPTVHQDIIDFGQCDGVVMTGCVIEYVNQALYTFGSINCNINDNLFRQVQGRSSGAGFNLDAYGGGFSGNAFISCGPLLVGGQSQNIRINGNNFYDTQLLIQSATPDQMSDIAVTGNVWTMPPTSTQGSAVIAGSVFGLSVTGNVVNAANNPASVMNLKAAALGSFQPSGDVVIVGNTFNTAVTGSNKILNFALDPLVEPTVVPGVTMANGSGVVQSTGTPFLYDSNSGGTVTYTANTLSDTSKTWTTNQWVGQTYRSGVVVTGGTDVNSSANKVASNTATVITLTANWASTPSAGTQYAVSTAFGAPMTTPGAGRGGTPLFSKITDVYSTSIAGMNDNAHATVSGVQGLFGAAGGAVIGDNIFDAANSGGQGLVLNGDYIDVHDNIFRGFTGGSALIDNGTVNNWVHGNRILNGSVTRPATSIWRHNVGVNPVDVVTTPAFPATTVAQTNSTGVDVDMYIVNGSGSTLQVNIDGHNLFTIAISAAIVVPLQAGQNVSFAYSSGAPAWTWLGR